MKNISVHRELNTDQIYIYYHYFLKNLQKNFRKRGEYFGKKSKN